jgi:hypothetical protein
MCPDHGQFGSCRNFLFADDPEVLSFLAPTGPQRFTYLNKQIVLAGTNAGHAN